MRFVLYNIIMYIKDKSEYFLILFLIFLFVLLYVILIFFLIFYVT